MKHLSCVFLSCVIPERREGHDGIKHYLCKHGLPVLSYHGALVTVQGDAGVVEGLLGVFEDVVQLGDAALKHRAEVAGDQCSADGCRGRQSEADSFNTQRPNTVLMDQSG